MSNPTAFASGERVPKPRRGSVYRGDAGMWSWVAHRITGVLTFFFLFAHVLDTALVRVSPEAYNTIIETYKNPLVNLMEVGLVGAVLYHALNGIRIMLVDFWAKGAKYQRLMLWILLGDLVRRDDPRRVLHVAAHRQRSVRWCFMSEACRANRRHRAVSPARAAEPATCPQGVTA